MKINKFIKVNKSNYKLILNNGEEIVINEELILKFDLLITRTIEDLDFLKEENEYYQAYDKAIKYIAKRMRTRREVLIYLKDYKKNIVYRVIDKLRDENIINDKVYISSYVHDSLLLKTIGRDKIYEELINLGLREYDINAELDKVDKQIYYDKINDHINKALKKDMPKKRLHAKIMYYLTTRGFRREDILLCIDNFNLSDDEDSLEKEYQALYKKYHEKYDKYKLKQVLLNKLYHRGYEMESIKRVIGD